MRGKSQYIRIDILGTLHALEVLPLDQHIDALLDYWDSRLKSTLQLIDDLGNQRVMMQLAARLHDAHDGRLDLKLAVLLQRTLRLIILHALHGADRDVDVDLLALRPKLYIQRKHVQPVKNKLIQVGVVGQSRLARQNLQLEQRSNGPPENRVGERRLLRHVGERDGRLVVKEEQQPDLVRR